MLNPRYFAAFGCTDLYWYQSHTSLQDFGKYDTGPVVATSEGSLNSDMSIVLFIGAISFTVLTIGYVMAGMRLTKLEMRLEDLQRQYEERLR